jgi:tRNA pseudouridine38-40 synthase
VVRIALGLEYDGTDWNGWQTQPDGRTVQDRLEAAIAAFAGAPHDTICAGRTDAGVHARGQVVHLDTLIDRPDWNWVRGLNAHLPASIAVRWARPVDPSFHARFSAVIREYRYRILLSPTRSPLQDRQATWFYRPLDVQAMQRAARILEGEHDFSAFRSADCQAHSPVRRLERIELDHEGEVLVIVVRANAFLHHMVRNLVGSLVEVGRGAASQDWLRQVLDSRDRTLAARTFPARGLCLERVEYDPPL